MAITASNITNNYRGLAFQFTGDGATTSITVPSGATPLHPGTTATVRVRTGSTTFDNYRSGSHGLREAINGTPVTATVTTSGNNVTVVTSPAVSNATVAYVSVLFDQVTG